MKALSLLLAGCCLILTISSCASFENIGDCYMLQSPENQKALLENVERAPTVKETRQTSTELAYWGFKQGLSQNDFATGMRLFNKSWQMDPDNYLPYWGAAAIYATKAAEIQYGQSALTYQLKAMTLFEIAAEKLGDNPDNDDDDAVNFKLDYALALARQGYVLRRLKNERSKTVFTQAYDILIPITEYKNNNAARQKFIRRRAYALLSFNAVYQDDTKSASLYAEKAKSLGYIFPDEHIRKISKYSSGN